MNKTFTAIIICLSFLSPRHSFAWSRDGHDMVAEIAFRLLSPQAKQKLFAYLNQTFKTIHKSVK
jgi:hypothetical protein